MAYNYSLTEQTHKYNEHNYNYLYFILAIKKLS
jgi:hypothetical protein